MSTGARLRVALVGYGLSGRVFHAPLVSATAEMALVSVVTADPGRAAQARRDLPGVRLLARVEELWTAAADHDLVVLATATASHVELALAALDHGMAVVVEKPPATEAEGVGRLAAAAARLGLVAVPFFNRRWDSDQLTLRRLLAGGALGSVLRYESRFERWRPRLEHPGWREALPGAQGGGVLLDLGVHLVDQALVLFGPAQRVYAEIDARRSPADDDVFVALAHRSGVRSHLWAGALSAAPGPRLRVLGSEAAFVVDALDGQEDALRRGLRPGDDGFGTEPPERWGQLRRGPDVPPEPVPSEPGRWDTFYPAVAATLLEGVPPPVTLDEALSVQLVLDAARRSAETAQVVELAAT